MRSFLSPYGDGTYPVMDNAYIDLFSPPYGDSTPTYVRFLVAEHVFAPLRGWYGNSFDISGNVFVFAPLRGWYTKYITEYRKMEELNA